MTNLWDAFHQSLTLHSDRPALTFEDQTWTYQDLGRAVGAISTSLRDAGVGPGSRVIILLSNGLAFPATDLAVMAVGAVKTPLNAMLSAREVEIAIDRVEPTCIVTDDVLEHLLSTTGAGIARIRLTQGWFDDVPAGDALPERHSLGEDSPAAIYLSGGTTGLPKGIVHSQSSVIHNLWAHLIESGINRDERLLLTTPLPHSAGLFTATALLCGAHSWIEAGFDAERLITLVDEHQITWTYGVPTMIKRVIDSARHRNWQPSSLRTIQYGSAPMSPLLLVEALDIFGPIMQQLYAQTECPQYATLLRKDDHARAADQPHLLASAGRSTIMCEVTVRDESGHCVPSGTTAEVCLRSPYVMTGLWKDSEGFAARFHDDWVRTGDLGYLDHEGYLYLVDRLADMVVSGGMNVYSIEVEDALTGHGDVRQAAVIGRPSSEWGEAVHAFIVTDRQDTDELQQELIGRCRRELSAYKVPKSYEFIESVPLTPYGKMDKKLLRAKYWQNTARAVN